MGAAKRLFLKYQEGYREGCEWKKENATTKVIGIALLPENKDRFDGFIDGVVDYSRGILTKEG